MTADENRRIEVFERELWRIAVEHLDYGEQVQWAALAGARVAPAGWRRARAMLHFDQGGELKRTFLITAVDRNKNAQLRLRALQEIAASRDAEAFDRALDFVESWPRDDKREGVKVVLQALAEKKIGRRDQANNWIWRCANMTREVHEEYAVQRWPETKRLLGLLVNSSGGAHARNARRLVHAARQQDRRLCAALLAAAIPHTAEAGEVVNGARTRMSRKPAALARELLRNFPKGKGRRGTRRRKKKGAPRASRRRRRWRWRRSPTSASWRTLERRRGGRRRPRRRRSRRRRTPRKRPRRKPVAAEGPPSPLLAAAAAVEAAAMAHPGRGGAEAGHPPPRGDEGRPRPRPCAERDAEARDAPADGEAGAARRRGRGRRVRGRSGAEAGDPPPRGEDGGEAAGDPPADGEAGRAIRSAKPRDDGAEAPQPAAADGAEAGGQGPRRSRPRASRTAEAGGGGRSGRRGRAARTAPKRRDPPARGHEGRATAPSRCRPLRRRGAADAPKAKPAARRRTKAPEAA